jgi:chromate transporter
MVLLLRIFWLFSRVALFSWGGGPASMALMQRETTSALWLPPQAVAPVPWVSTNEFADALAMSNALPGPIAPQVSAFIGYKLAGVPGAIAATAGTVLPTTILMLILVTLFFRIKDSSTMRAMLQAVRPVVVGLLLWTAYEMTVTVFAIRKLGWGPAVTQGWDKVLIVMVTFAVLVLTRVNPVFVILGSALFGLLVYRG